jgi:multimeric flavodoxin WrbA
MEKLEVLYNYLKNKNNKKILFLTTSNRWEGDKEMPKSSIIADELSNKLENCKIINVSKLKIYPCEGNVSTKKGNTCGLKDALLKDNKKNPHKFIRCWASINNKDDEMYRVANAIYESDIIIFFGSVRWGKLNAIYANLLERLTWIENIHNTLGEENILKNKETGVVVLGQNWNGANVVNLEKDVLKFFGFKTPSELSFNWQFLNNPKDESQKSYKEAYDAFIKEFNFKESLKESEFSSFMLRKIVREVLK